MSLCLKHQTSSSRTIISTIEIHSTDTIPILNSRIQTSGPGRDSSIGNHDIETAEVLDDGCYCCLDFGVFLDLDFVDSGLDAEVCGDFCGLLGGGGGGGVPDGNLEFGY
jgi:hypothetical protein